MFAGRNYQRGILLIDALMALFLGAAFIVILAEASDKTRYIFEFARERDRLFDVYEAHANEFGNMMPYERKSIELKKNDKDTPATTTMSATAKWYGNDRIETDITISSALSGTTTVSRARMPFDQSVTFVTIRAYPFQDISQAAGTPLCSVEFSKKDAVGSYLFLHPTAKPYPSAPLVPHIVPITLPINPLLPLTDMEVRNGIAYISTDSTNATDPDIIVANIRSPTSTTILSSINTGPGIASIALAGKRVFAAATSMVGQLHVIRFDTLASPMIESKFKLPLPYATATAPLASSIFYSDTYIHLGTEKWDGPEFLIIDVSSPGSPAVLGSLETGTKINDIFVRDSVAYVAASDEKQMRMIDISDQYNPRLIESFSPTGWERQEGNVVSYFEDILRLGRTSGGFNITQDHELFSWSTSTVRAHLSLIPATYSLDMRGGIYGIIPDRNRLFIATRQVNKELQIIGPNLSTSTAQTISLPVAPQTITCDGNKLYVLAKTAPVIYQITF